MKNTRDQDQFVLYTANQLASSLIRTIIEFGGMSRDEAYSKTFDVAKIHFHGKSGFPIAWNDVQEIQFYNAAMGTDYPIPAVATEGNNQHYHTSETDGGWIPGSGPHDHRDNYNGGFAFACLHPGTAIPQQPWALY